MQIADFQYNKLYTVCHVIRLCCNDNVINIVCQVMVIVCSDDILVLENFKAVATYSYIVIAIAS